MGSTQILTHTAQDPAAACLSSIMASALAHLWFCSSALVQPVTQIEAPECGTAACFLNYARPDLLLGKYLACLSSVVRGAVKSSYHCHSSDVCSCDEAGTDNLAASTCAAQCPLESPRSSQFSQNTHNSKPSRNT